MAAGIYSITLKPTGERYIGSTINIKKRRCAHWSILRRTYADGCVPIGVSAKGGGIYTAAIYYDPDIYFEFQVLEELPPDGKILAEREKYWVEVLDSTLNIRRKISRRDQAIDLTFQH